MLEPNLGSHLAAIVLMGGNAFCGGNASPAAEANILNDPEAADIVFGADCQIVMAGLDVTEKAVMTSVDLAGFASVDNARAQHLAKIIPFYERFYRQRLGLDGIFVHDSTTISYLLSPESFSWVEHPIRVDCGHSVCRGKTQPATYVSDHESAWSGRRAVRILTGVDSRVVVELELQRLRR
jgi:inosine-uridine nucleoside N-ribohydrolase